MLTTFTDKGDSHVIDLNDIVAWYLITLALGFITTSLRISIKLSPKNKERMCMEDYLIVGGTLSSMVIAAIIVALVNSDLMVIKDHFDLAMDHLYGTCLASAKLGILALYYRVFVSAVFRRFVIGTAILIVLWWISLELIAMTYCFPFRKIWEVSMEEGWCMNFQAVGFYETIANLVLNLWIFFLPLHPIVHLQTTLRRKIVYGLLFSCGAGTCVVSAFRINEMRFKNPKVRGMLFRKARSSGDDLYLYLSPTQRRQRQRSERTQVQANSHEQPMQDLETVNLTRSTSWSCSAESTPHSSVADIHDLERCDRALSENTDHISPVATEQPPHSSS
ncbi:integral membrane protein PTH11-like protein [Ascosphaera apis ARSEF 7405]|uniref:Integral membrane protein PTH11-like protein n=1 Tax=Ascosphaera apis ARSEF 7405 TaxID=392613 RepID=A0A168AKS3_9EURO|nr:integral membrane protein PTH11-like protein [Ascosphaera apis ARSEF 7405]